MKRLLVLALVLTMALVATPSTAVAISGTFTDDDGSVHEQDIEAIAELGVTNGCGVALFCPDVVVTREQMASFIVRALELEPVGTGPFTDLLPNVHAADINALAAAGITLGCDVDRYCPTDPVQRDQMASFLARAFDLEPSSDVPFTDVPTENPHLENIGAIRDAGITLGCDVDRYCPTDPVLRGQMASFLRRALGIDPIPVRLPLYEGMPLTCTKDGLVCRGSVSIAYRPTYRIEEGFYQITPATDDELDTVRAGGTRIDVIVDGIRTTLAPGEEVTEAGRLVRPFTATSVFSPGQHSVVAQWFLDGRLVQTVELTLSVG